MIMRPWCAMVSNARPHEEGLESEVYRPSFMNILWMYWGCDTGCISLKHSFQWWLCQLLAVHLTGMWCSGHGRIPVAHRSWNITHRMWWLVRVWHQIMWWDLTFSMNSWTQHLIWQCWRHGSNLSSEKGSHRWRGCSAVGRTYFAVSVHSVLNECFASHWIDQGLTTFLAPLAWPPHSPDLTTQAVPCGVVSRAELLRIATPPMKIFAVLWKMPFAPLLHKWSSIKVHIRVPWTWNQEVHRWFKLIFSDYDCTLHGVQLLLAHLVVPGRLICVSVLTLLINLKIQRWLGTAIHAQFV